MWLDSMLERIERKILGFADFKKKKDLYSKIISYGDLVFDIGANHGDRTKIFLYLGAKVVAVEPNQILCDKLKRKFGDRISIEQKAVGDSCGKTVLFINETDVLSTTSEEWIDSIRKSGRFGELVNHFNKKIEVEVITINDLIEFYGIPKFAKIDVEGGEFQIIKTIKNSSICALCFEFAIPESLDNSLKCLTHLNNIGYDFFNISFGESFQFLSDKRMNISEISNLLYNLPSMSWGEIYAFSNKTEIRDDSKIC